MKYKKFKDLNSKEKNKFYMLIFTISLGFNIMFIGGTLNQLVMYFNDNRMPVLMYEGYYTQDKFHSFHLDITETKLYFLSDIIKIKDNIYSIGDFVLYLGGLVVILCCILLALWKYKLEHNIHKKMKKYDVIGLLLSYISIPIFLLIWNAEYPVINSYIIYNIDIIILGETLRRFIVIFGLVLFSLLFTILILKKINDKYFDNEKNKKVKKDDKSTNKKERKKAK